MICEMNVLYECLFIAVTIFIDSKEAGQNFDYIDNF